MQNIEPNYLHVAVGVIRNSAGQVLIALRDKMVHQGGLWEFPGGKVEQGESAEQALKRELKEELDISVHSLIPLIKVKHQYTDLNVLLDVWTITQFSGDAVGKEGQVIKWINVGDFMDYVFPEANYPIITAARLPSRYAILNGEDVTFLLDNLSRFLDNGLTLIQARVKPLSVKNTKLFFESAIPLCREKGACLMVNSAVKEALTFQTDGLHLTSNDLLSINKKPVGYRWVSASCHNQTEIQHAQKIGLDFIVLASVLPTQTHPESQPLGWGLFKELVDKTTIPVFALGGMQEQYLPKVQLLGAQGIAGISGF